MRAIDADALIERIKDFPYGYRGMIKNEIEQMPTLDVVPTDFHDKCMKVEIEKRMVLEPKHGRWNTVVHSNNHITYYCPICGSIFNKGCADLGKYNYCPNCGADMREMEEEVLEVWDLDGSPTRYIKGERMDESTMNQVKVDVSINKPTERWDTCGLSENDILVDSGARGERREDG